jgi:hypothetical protein
MLSFKLPYPKKPPLSHFTLPFLTARTPIPPAHHPGSIHHSPQDNASSGRLIPNAQSPDTQVLPRDSRPCSHPDNSLDEDARRCCGAVRGHDWGRSMGSGSVGSRDTLLLAVYDYEGVVVCCFLSVIVQWLSALWYWRSLLCDAGARGKRLAVGFYTASR